MALCPGARSGGANIVAELFAGRKFSGAASFAVTFRIGSSVQLSLLPETAGLGEQLVDDLLSCFEMLDRGDDQSVRERIPDPAYFRNFVTLAAKIAPDWASGRNRAPELTRIFRSRNLRVMRVPYRGFAGRYCMTAMSEAFRLIPTMDTRAGIMSDIAHEWTNVCGGSATSAEVAGRWGLDPTTCGQILDELVERGVLSRRTDGRYRYAAHDWRGDDRRVLGVALLTQD